MFESVLRIAGMVSKTSILLIGAAVLLLGVTLKSNGIKGSVSPEKPIENQQLTGLNQILSEAMSVLKNTFKDPMIPKGLTTGGKTFPCRGPNCLGSQGAAGVRAAFDPFTGQRTVIGFSARGSPKTQNFFGDISGNLSRITAGNQIKLDLTNFIAGIKQQIGILESTNTVTL